MNRPIKHILFALLILIHIDANSQTIIKQVSGNVYQLINNIKKPIRGLNTIVNDSSTLKLEPSAYMIVEIKGQYSIIKAADCPNGIIKLMNISNNLEIVKASGFWSNIFAAVYGDLFDDKIEIDGLTIAKFQGTTRSSSKNLSEWKVLPNYQSKIEWPGGMKFEINFQGKTIMLKTKEELSYFNIDKDVLGNCNPCHVKVDNEERGFIAAVLLSNEDKILLESLFSNIDNEVDIEISQFCVIRLFITNDLFINANYYIDKFSDNKLIKDYFIDIQLQ
jgi:hypothetical protein